MYAILTRRLVLATQFYILDVFAEEKYEGNQLAVVRDAEALSEGQMQKIAKEKPELSDKWLLALQHKTRKFLDGNGTAFA